MRYKLFSKTGSFSGYVCGLIPYTSKIIGYDIKQRTGPSVLINFSKVHPFSNTHFTFDNYYSSTEMLMFLENNKRNYTYTSNPLRKCFPNEIRETKLVNKYENKLLNTNLNILL